MIDSVSVNPVAPLPSPASAASPAQGPGFGEVLRGAIERVEASGRDAAAAAEQFLSGASTDVHSAALAAQRASLQFEYVLQIRNKVVQAYQEVMRMQL